MMYNEKLAVAIKSAGKVLRENKDTVYLPFGSEYSVLIKNLNSVRVLAKVSIDNQPVDESGDGFVIDANSSLDLERFIKSGNLNEGNRFKFIERTGRIEEHRGVQVEDGLIRVEFQFEKRPPKVEEVHTYHHHHYDWDYWYPPRRYLRRGCWGDVYYSDNSRGLIGNAGSPTYTLTSSSGGGAIGGSVSNTGAGVVSANMVQTGGQGGSVEGSGEAVNLVASNHAVMDSLINDVGITVAGSKSDQKFVTVGSFPLEEASHVIVLKILGATAQGKRVVQPVTVKSKQRCTTCGHVNKANAKFCTECGTALELL
jgi:hypothetical protein